MYFLSFKEAAANKKLLDHNLKEKRVQRLPLRVSLFYIKIGKPIKKRNACAGLMDDGFLVTRLLEED